MTGPVSGSGAGSTASNGAVSKNPASRVRATATRNGPFQWMVALALVTALGTVAPAAAGGLTTHIPATLWGFLVDRSNPAEESVRRVRAVAAALAAAVRSLHSGTSVSQVHRGEPLIPPTSGDHRAPARLGHARHAVATRSPLPERLLAIPPPFA